MDGWSNEGCREVGSQKLEDQGQGQRCLEAITRVGQDPTWVLAPGWVDGWMDDFVATCKLVATKVWLKQIVACFTSALYLLFLVRLKGRNVTIQLLYIRKFCLILDRKYVMKRDSTCSAVSMFAARFQPREFGEGAMIVNCIANLLVQMHYYFSN
jgi:hypothetical protein